MDFPSKLAQLTDRADSNFWQMLRQEVLPLRPSQYDLTSSCNLSCEGCLFFSGNDYVEHQDSDDLDRIDSFFSAEAERGVRFAYFGGAEPSMVMPKLAIAARHISYGVIFTNGTLRIIDEIPFRIHVSIWGTSARSRKLRGADILQKQLRNYRGDRRAIFVLTVTAQNIDDIEPIAAMCADNDIALTFNHYSPTKRYIGFVQGEIGKDKYHAFSTESDNLLLQPQHLSRAREMIDRLLDEPSRYKVIYDHEFNALIHRPEGLYDDLSQDTATALDCGVRLTSTLRHINTDLSRSHAKCCTPNVECRTCRLYAQSFATILARATRNIRHDGGHERMVRLWRLWCDIFLNNDKFRSH